MKKRTWRTIVTLLLVAAMMLVGCGSKSSSSDEESGDAAETTGEPKKVYVVAPDQGSAWTRFKQGMEDACAEYGWEGTLTAPTTPYDAVEMAELCETAVNAGADVIMIFTADVEFFKDVIEDAKSAGVYMIAIAKPNEYCDLRVGADDAELGESIAEALVGEMGDTPIKCVEMMSDVTSEGQMNQITPFEEKLMELAPDAEIVSRIDCDYNAANAADNMSATYAAHPEANCVISIDGDGVVGCCSFVSDYDLEGQFVVVGVNDDASVLTCLKEGTLNCTVISPWYDFGYHAVELAYSHLIDGEELEFSQSIPSITLYPDEVDEYAEENGIDLNQ